MLQRPRSELRREYYRRRRRDWLRSRPHQAPFAFLLFVATSAARNCRRLAQSPSCIALFCRRLARLPDTGNQGEAREAIASSRKTSSTLTRPLTPPISDSKTGNPSISP